MPIENATLDGRKLTFKASRGPEIEMILTSEDTAKLRFPGTAMEDVSFEVYKTTF